MRLEAGILDDLGNGDTPFGDDIPRFVSFTDGSKRPPLVPWIEIIPSRRVETSRLSRRRRLSSFGSASLPGLKGWRARGLHFLASFWFASTDPEPCWLSPLARMHRD
jgi:hypothetical protein